PSSRNERSFSVQPEIWRDLIFLHKSLSICLKLGIRMRTHLLNETLALIVQAVLVEPRMTSSPDMRIAAGVGIEHDELYPKLVRSLLHESDIAVPELRIHGRHDNADVG
ncbi:MULTISPECIES: hypothetical protein, partial [Mesorhizobium]|uniref:hypothetical protein n=1 Tax=Mesorhizobium TaxID=68287 RepID=UPI0019D283DA